MKLIHILVVEDYPLVQIDKKEMIEKEKDMMVTVEKTQEKALEQLRDKVFDMVIVDLVSPIEEVIRFIRRVISINSDIAILMVSVFDPIVHFNHFIDAGISAFIRKSFSQEEMIRSIRCLKRGDAIIPTPLLKKLRRG